ncbi:uncharacterized protein si:dkey-92i15.4 [Cololabis saira]|uniref:uncharacterized protein si:dkey-92i15.4 n=1 Tax=Cololabis saira TaxID=129043 RepID=UPI002AD2F6E4|nr:uncharacterized protein si:dkey-92i15.4 [Cololabis saira]XP_061572837.1 uncharacterized protein si:dkey-92i15.4 [Cololabis saira]
MDLSLFPAPLGEYDKQRTGKQFTVRSANSPSYSLTRRPGVRKRETAEDVEERERQMTDAAINAENKEERDAGYQATTWSSSVKDESKEKDASGYPVPTNQSSKADKTPPESGADGREKTEFERQGRTEGKRYNLPSRSKSLDWKIGARSSVPGSRADTSITSPKIGGDLSEQPGGLLDGKMGTEIGMMGGAAFSVQDYKSAGATYSQHRISVNPTSPISNTINRGNSLPYRFRSQSGPSSKFPESSNGPKGGESIQERIEKLLGSASEKSASFPRRFSGGENKCPLQSRMAVICTQKDTNTFGCEGSLPPDTNTAKEKSATGQRQSQFHSRYSDEVKWGKWTIESGTKSLDRARSKNTKAAQIRSIRTAGEITDTTKPSSFLEIFKDSSEFSEKSLKVGNEDRRPQFQDEKTNEMLSEKSGRLSAQEKEKEKNERAKEQTVQKTGSVDEDVFETNPQKSTLNTVETKKMLLVPSVESVRKKISQFEALTQRAAGQVPLPRRTFSVPTPFRKGFQGIKKSGSAKEISGRSDIEEGLKEAGEKEKAMGGGKKFASERSLSVDEVGLRRGKMETGGNCLLDETNFSEDFCKNSRLKEKLHIPLNEGGQRQSRKTYLDETDFSKVFHVQLNPHCEATSPGSDDDKIPTNLPDNSPFISPSPQTENDGCIAEKKKTRDLTNADESEGSAAPPLPLTLHNSSYSDLSGLHYSDVKTVGPKGKKFKFDPSAWLAGLNPDYKVFDDDEDDYEDDDESTQVDEDSNYDSDSGESSGTITSNMSQSDRRSFSVSLSELWNFAGPDSDLDEDNDVWQSTTRRSVSMCSDISDVSVFSCVSMLPTEELDKLLQDVRKLGDDALQDTDGVQVVVLHKEVGVGLGFSLAGGVDQNKPITVHRVFHSGVAAHEGSIREGDQVLSINGTALSGSPHLEVLRVLKKAKAKNPGVVVLRRGDVSSPLNKGVQECNEEATQAQYETGQRVQLQKKGRDLGFSLQGGVDSSEGNRPLTVKKIFQGGPFDKVCPGDEVIEIEGMSMVGMRRLDAWSFIKKLPPGPVEMVLRRPLKHVPS